MKQALKDVKVAFQIPSFAAIVGAAVLFGMLYQGGAVLAQDTKIPVQMVIVIQALVIMFTGALDNMVRAPLEKFYLARRDRQKAGA